MRTWPTVLSFSRVVLTIIVICALVMEVSIFVSVILFAIAALTDFFDGYLARRWNVQTEFGAKADMVADRVLWIGTAITTVSVFGSKGILTALDYSQMVALMTREIITAPFALCALVRGCAFPSARRVAKITTGVQGFALPAFLLSIFFPMLRAISIPLATIVAVFGLLSARHYIRDTGNFSTKKVAPRSNENRG